MIVKPDVLLAVLRSARQPLVAVSLAGMCGVSLEHETARRRIREAVEVLRGQGEKICAHTIHGYWMESKSGEFARYLEHRRAGDVRDLARVGKVARASDGSATLFDLGRDRAVEAIRG